MQLFSQYQAQRSIRYQVFRKGRAGLTGTLRRRRACACPPPPFSPPLRSLWKFFPVELSPRARVPPGGASLVLPPAASASCRDKNEERTYVPLCTFEEGAMNISLANKFSLDTSYSKDGVFGRGTCFVEA